jgi:hypothetical protein
VVSARTLSVFTTPGGVGLLQQRPVHCSTTPGPQRAVILPSVDGCGTRGAQRDPAEPGSRDRVRDLPAQRLITQPVPVLEEHHPQVGLDRDRRATPQRGEVRREVVKCSV